MKNIKGKGGVEKISHIKCHGLSKCDEIIFITAAINVLKSWHHHHSRSLKICFFRIKTGGGLIFFYHYKSGVEIFLSF